MADKGDINLYNVNDGITGRDGGPYLDHVEAEQAEIVRARREGRQPNLKDPGPYVGQQLVSEAQLLQRGIGTPIPSKEDIGSALVAKGAKEVLAKPTATVKAEDTEKFVPGSWLIAPEDKDAEDATEPEQTDLLKELAEIDPLKDSPVEPVKGTESATAKVDNPKSGGK